MKVAAKVGKEQCTGCGICVDACPQEAISLNDIAKVDPEKCTDCGTCVDECPNDAISMPG
jgi:ferredoxin